MGGATAGITTTAAGIPTTASWFVNGLCTLKAF